MLVLTRKTRESVVIGNLERLESVLKVTVLQIKGGGVKLGFEVADDVLVHRSEVWERIRATASQTLQREFRRRFARP